MTSDTLDPPSQQSPILRAVAAAVVALAGITVLLWLPSNGLPLLFLALSSRLSLPPRSHPLLDSSRELSTRELLLVPALFLVIVLLFLVPESLWSRIGGVLGKGSTGSDYVWPVWARVSVGSIWLSAIAIRGFRTVRSARTQTPGELVNGKAG